MNDSLLSMIESIYGIKIVSVVDAPRQFVAETYFIETSDLKKYFVKIVTKPLFIPHIIESLPILKQLYDLGLQKINYPIPTIDGQLYLKQEDTLVVLFNYINAPQTEQYDMFTFGRMLAELHQITPKISLNIPTEKYEFKYLGKFEQQFEDQLSSNSVDEISAKLKTLLLKYESEIRRDYANFIQLCNQLQHSNYSMVVTHGDPGGNILAASPTDLFLVDWDDILLSPPERDTWFFRHDSEFIRGYQSLVPEYQPNQPLCHFFTYKRYFEDLIEYFAEILGNGSHEHRQSNLTQLTHDCMEGWLRPSIRKFDPLN